MQYIVHIGYPKAASTWLQTILFSGKDPRIQPLKVNGETIIANHRKSGAAHFFNEFNSDVLKKSVRLVNPYSFDAKETREAIEKTLPDSGDYTCLSSESWAGHPLSGGITARELANRIKETLPNAKILMVIRKQEDMILSAYTYYLTMAGGLASLKRYLNADCHDQIPSHSPYYYCYDQSVSYYKSIFGADNVLALPFELLSQKGEKEFLSAIYSFLGLTPHEDLPNTDKQNVSNQLSYAVLRTFPLLNLLSCAHPANGNAGIGLMSTRNFLIKALGLLFSKKRIQKILDRDKKAMASFIAPYARPSNQKLQEFMPFNLKELGYKM